MEIREFYLVGHFIKYFFVLRFQGGQQIFKTVFQDFPGLFKLKTFIFQGVNLFFLGLDQAAKDFLHAYVRTNCPCNHKV